MLPRNLKTTLVVPGLLVVVFGGGTVQAGGRDDAGGTAVSAPPSLQTPMSEHPPGSVHTLGFEANTGQLSSGVRFSRRMARFTVEVLEAGVALSWPLAEVAGGRGRLSWLFEGSASGTAVEGEGPRATAVASYVGGDRARWRSGIPTYDRVRLRGVYPGIDVVLRESGGELEYDLEGSPGADYSRVHLRFVGVDGLAVDASGDLVVDTPHGVVTHHRPVVHQDLGGEKVQLDGTFTITASGAVTVSMTPVADPQAHTLVDPVVSTSWAPRGVFQSFHKVAIDRDGTTYVSGTVATASEGSTSSDIFVARLAANREDLAGVLFLGGSGDESVVDMVTDGSGAVTVIGSTESTDFPVTSGSPPEPIAGSLFAARFDMRAPRLVWATVIGGDGNDLPAALALAGTSDALVVGRTYSIDFPVSSDAYDSSCGTDGLCNESPVDKSRYSDAFLARFDGSTGELAYATYLGGRDTDWADGVVVDASDNAVIVGRTGSRDYPATAGAFDEGCGTDGRCDFPAGDAFVTALAPDGRSLVFSTFLGGQGYEAAHSVALEPGGGLSIVGTTSSADFPLRTPLQAGLRGHSDIFLARLDGNGRELAYSTYFGGTDDDSRPGWTEDRDFRLSVDGAGRTLLAFRTAAKTLPLVLPMQPCQWSWGDGVAPGDVYLIEIDTATNAVPFATYLGGNGGEGPAGMALHGDSAIVLTGGTSSIDFPGTPLQLGHVIGGAPFVATLDRGQQLADLRVAFGPPAGVHASTLSPGLTVTVTNDGPAAATSAALAVWLGAYQNSAMEVAASQGACRAQSYQVLCELGTLAAGSQAWVTVGFSGYSPPESALAVTRSLVSDPAPASNTATVGFADRPTTDLALAGPSHEIEAVLDQERVIEFTVTNSGAAPAPDVACVGHFPDAFAVTRATATAGACAVSGSTVTCGIGELGAGGTARVTVTVRPARTGTFEALVFAGGRLTDPSADNDRWQMSVTVSAPFPAAFQRLVPAVAHNPGAGGTMWRTDLAVVNPNAASAAVTLRPRTNPPLAAQTVTLAPMAAVDWHNVLESVFGVAPDRNVSGVVEIAADRPLGIAARTYNQGAAGTYGQDYPALRFNAEETTTLLGLRKSGQFRTNIGYVNMGDRRCALDLTLYDAGGRALGLTRQVTLAPGEWRQEFDVFAQLHAGAQEQASGNSGGDWLDCGSVWMYASVIDTRTGDPATTTDGACSPCIIPSVAHLPGAGGTAWRTDITLANPAFGTPYSIELYYIAGDDVLVRAVELPGSTTREWRDVLVSLFGYGPDARTSGTLVVVPSHAVSAVARTYNATPAGTFGQQYQPLLPGEGLVPGQRGVIPQLRRNAAFRSNAGIVNTGGTSVDVSLRVYDGDGTPLGEPVIIRVAPWRWKQINDILGVAGAGDRDVAYALVEILTPDGSAWGYGSLIDRGSGDPTTIPMVVVEEP